MRLPLLALAVMAGLVKPLAAQTPVQITPVQTIPVQITPASGAVARIGSLEEALRIGEANSPRLRVAEARREAAGGDRLQAEARPNPELFVDADNFAGSKSYRGSRNIEVAAGISQTIEMGGKREARIGFADAGLALAGHERDVDQLALREEIARGYVSALYAARVVALEGDRLKNAQALAGAVRERVQNGREPPFQARKSEIAQAAAEVATQKAEREYAAVLATLAGSLGVTRIDLANDGGWFERSGALPNVGPDEESLRANPDFSRAGAAIAQARTAIAKEQSAAVPDPTLRAGIRRYNEDDSNAFMVGISIPIPVFDSNRGGIQRARQELVRAEAEADALRLNLLASLAKARQSLQAAHREVEVLSRTIIPAADETYAAAAEGYAAGKFGFLDLLDAQRTQFDVKAQHATALRDYHLARIELMRLAGRTY
ncbi:TolC family protein [Ferrovibrio sp. MS7]|uniref:TolC family protein n=1 Tax=Ferrovibrio plantarum TaxID=3119164 RepID=UPI0031354C3C